MSDLILGCPWCGVPAQVTPEYRGGHIIGWRAECMHQGCDSSVAVFGEDEKGAVAAWNRRTPTTLPPSERAEGERVGAARERAAVVADLRRQRFRVRDGRGYYDEAGGWSPEDDEAANFDRIISEWIDLIERGDHIPAAPPEQVTGPTKPEDDDEELEEEVSDWAPALAMALHDVLPLAVVGVQHHERDRREQAEARLRLAADVQYRYQRATTVTGPTREGT